MPFRKPHQTSDPNFIDKNGTGGFVIKPKGLNIIWGNDLRYWKITADDNAELIQVSWLEVSGKVRVQPGTYKVKFEVDVKENGFGWDNTTVLVMAKIGKRGSYKYEEVNLVCRTSPTLPNDNKPLLITVKDQEPDPELHFGLYEVWSGKWKGGLVIKRAEVLKIS